MEVKPSQSQSCCPLSEYPRPQMVRKQPNEKWKNLNGHWDYAVTSILANASLSKSTSIVDEYEEKQTLLFSNFPNQWDGKIVVPYAIESPLSEVQKPLSPKQTLWYHRSFRIDTSNFQNNINTVNPKVLLHFEAVDWKCHVFINKNFVGSHTGGYIPFSFDVTDHLHLRTSMKESNDENELIVAVWDPTDSHWQQRGKQVLNPNTIYYTATSGIWQTVWLEIIESNNYIKDIKMTPDIDKECLNLKIYTNTCVDGYFQCQIFDENKRLIHEWTEKSDNACNTKHNHDDSSCYSFVAPIHQPRLWGPNDPFLYSLNIHLHEYVKGNDDYGSNVEKSSKLSHVLVDSISTYFAMRKVENRKGKSGHARIFLNNQPIFLNGLLDQGYWPESGMTPPNEESILFDLQNTKELGFNMIRKHIKIEPRRWYYHADRMGLIVIQDMISGGANAMNVVQTLCTMRFGTSRKRDGFNGWCKRLLHVGKFEDDSSIEFHKHTNRESKGSQDNFEMELQQMVKHLYNVPSILIWVIFNESWGQFDSIRITNDVQAMDPSRLIDHASGWFDQGVGDFCSRHTYIFQLMKKEPTLPNGKEDNRTHFISEYGGYDLRIPGHLWNPKKIFGYKLHCSSTSLEASYKKLIRKQLIPLISQGLGAAVYTQLSDVEIEVNGLFTYDRKVLKMPKEFIHQLNEEIYQEFDCYEL